MDAEEHYHLRHSKEMPMEYDERKFPKRASSKKQVHRLAKCKRLQWVNAVNKKQACGETSKSVAILRGDWSRMQTGLEPVRHGFSRRQAEDSSSYLRQAACSGAGTARRAWQSAVAGTSAAGRKMGARLRKLAMRHQRATRFLRTYPYGFTMLYHGLYRVSRGPGV